jgi:hypothetical protein
MTALVDNDVLCKAACYGLLDELILPYCTKHCLPGVLGSARFVVSKTIKKKRTQLRGNVATALARLENFVNQSEVLEPTDSEQSFAADLESIAQRAGVSLDTGESLLCSIAVIRVIPHLLTGDKRAIRAIEELLEMDRRLSPLCGRVKCLEQLVLSAIDRTSRKMMKTIVCNEPDIDKTLSICFGCSSPRVSEDSFDQGLNSYIDDLRRTAPRVLAS